MTNQNSEARQDIVPGKRQPARDYPRVIEGATMQYKALETGEQVVSDRTVTGYAAVFGNVDMGNDRIHQGAFTKTLQERSGRIRNLWQHNTNEPPTAVVKVAREISRAELPAAIAERYPDATGALMVTREYLNTPRGDEVLAGIKAGAITEMSIGFDVPKGKLDYETVGEVKVRNLREIRLWEVSDVLWGMNPATRAAKGVESASTLDDLARLMDMIRLLEIGQEFKAGDVSALRRVAELLGTMLSSEPTGEGEPEAAKADSRPAEPSPSLDHGMLARLAIAERELQSYMGRDK